MREKRSDRGSGRGKESGIGIELELVLITHCTSNTIR